MRLDSTQPTTLNSHISTYMFRLSQMELRDLRSKYGAISEDLPHSLLVNSKRKTMVNRLAEEKFGTIAVDEYRQLCEKWDEFERSFTKTRKQRK